jgi:hypothetical protein
MKSGRTTPPPSSASEIDAGEPADQGALLELNPGGAAGRAGDGAPLKAASRTVDTNGVMNELSDVERLDLLVHVLDDLRALAEVLDRIGLVTETVEVDKLERLVRDLISRAISDLVARPMVYPLGADTWALPHRATEHDTAA